MEIVNLNEKVKKAKEAVAELEEPLKTEAFKKILDKLLEPDINQYSSSPIIHKKNSTKKRKINNSLNKSNAKTKEEAEKRKRELAEKINRTEHSQIHNLQKTLLKVLYIIKIMQDKEINGLTPPEISYILKEIFKIKASSESISNSLNRKEAQKYVDRNRIVIGRAVAYAYKLMKTGEDFLKEELKKNDNHITKTNEEREPD